MAAFELRDCLDSEFKFSSNACPLPSTTARHTLSDGAAGLWGARMLDSLWSSDAGGLRGGNPADVDEC